jgi:hypothetical protein
MRQVVEGVQHRRFLKSHLPLDGLPYRESAKYIYVGRDSRDIFMSAAYAWAAARRTASAPKPERNST